MMQGHAASQVQTSAYIPSSFHSSAINSSLLSLSIPTNPSKVFRIRILALLPHSVSGSTSNSLATPPLLALLNAIGRLKTRRYAFVTEAVYSSVGPLTARGRARERSGERLRHP